MKKDWPTRQKDMYIAEAIMEQFAENSGGDVGLFELVFCPHQKQMNVRLSGWVIALAEYLNNLYGENKGELITRLIISECLIQNQTIH